MPGFPEKTSDSKSECLDGNTRREVVESAEPLRLHVYQGGEVTSVGLYLMVRPSLR